MGLSKGEDGDGDERSRFEGSERSRSALNANSSSLSSEGEGSLDVVKLVVGDNEPVYCPDFGSAPQA